MKNYLLILGFALIAAQASAQPSPDEIARMLQPQSEQYAFSSTVTRALCMRLNPATVGQMYPMNAMYNFYEQKGKLLEHEILFQNYLFNFGWRRALNSGMDHKVDQFSLSMGFGVPEFLVGGCFQWISSDLPGNQRGTIWNIATRMVADPHVVISLTKRNMNQPVIGGVKLQGVQSIGVSVMPFAQSERMLIAFEYTLANDQRVKDGTLKAGIEGSITRNLRAYGLIGRLPEWGGTVAMVGLRLYVPFFGFGLNSAFEKFNKYSSSVGSVLFSPEPRGLQ